MSLEVIPCTVDELRAIWAAVTITPAVWTFRDGRCLYVEHLEDVGPLNHHCEVGVVGLTETGTRVMWIRPDDAWEFQVWLFDTADAEHLDDGAAPAHGGS